MSHPFDFENDDPYLGFLRDDSSQVYLPLFKSQENVIKVEMSEMDDEREPPKEEAAVKRKRSDNNAKSTSKKKVFYREKMATLISEKEMLEKEDYNYGELAHNGRGRSPISRDEQLRRNRESAKHSRQRRKQYVETLEEKNLQSQAIIQDLTQRLNEAERERDRLKEDNRSYIKAFLDAKNEEFEKMTEILQKKGKKSDQMISDQLKVMMAKFGAAGSERVATTDYCMKEILEILLGDVHKYLMHSALHNSGIFGMGSWSTFDERLCQQIGVEKEYRAGLSKIYRPVMLQEFETFQDITQRFYDAYRAVQHQAKIIEKIFEKVSLEFSDQNIARLLIWIEENKYDKEMKRIRAEWKTSIECPEEGGSIRKLTKFEMSHNESML